MAEPVAVAPGGDASGPDAPSDAPPAFAFEARRARMDWRAIHAVDVDRVMRENDIDTLESVLVRPRLVPRVPTRRALSSPTTTFSSSSRHRRSPRRGLATDARRTNPANPV
jgi:hypothetical protein